MPSPGNLGTVALVTTLAVLSSAAGPVRDDLADLIAEARRAGEACDFSAQRSALERAAWLDGLPSQRALVQTGLAALEWRLDGDEGAARRRLERAATLSAPFAAWRELARMETAGAHYPAARTAWRAAVRSSESREDQLDARLGFATAAVEEALAMRLTGAEGALQDLREGFRDVRSLVARGEGGRATARVLIRAALVLRDGDAALAGLRAYFAGAPGGTTWNRIEESYAELERTLATWSGEGARAEPGLIRALAGARLFVEAALVAHDPRAPLALRYDPEVAPILAYERYLRDVRALARESFRLRAAGERDRGRTKRAFERKTALLDAELRGRPRAPRVYGPALLGSLEERFGLWLWSGSKSGTFDLHMGHCLADSTDAETGARRIVLDSMVVSGFRGWCRAAGTDSIEWTARGTTVLVR